MSISAILGVLAALIAIVLLFVKMEDISPSGKIVLILILAALSVILISCETRGLVDPRPGPTTIITTDAVITATPISNTNVAPNVLRLFDCNVVDQRYAKLRENVYADTFGNKYKQEVYFSSDFYGGDITFSPLGKYSYFRGVIAVSEFEDYADPLEIEIFADDSSIFYTTTTKTTEPFTFNLNIGSSRTIKIVADGHIIIGDGEFYN